ncbi:MAG: hypothetical protein LBF55_07550 [Prevotellaceae bacterium]|jgi:hypothetical protein|nr:hypothetical protein [Prevotellaceae bacterium]
METSELTKEQKLEVIDEILAMYERDENYQYYICRDIKYTAYIKGYCNVSGKPLELIPELLMVKPKGANMRDSWFGEPKSPKNRPLRLAALRRLRKIVMNTEK